jgi:hypothetical protein
VSGLRHLAAEQKIYQALGNFTHNKHRRQTLQIPITLNPSILNIDISSADAFKLFFERNWIIAERTL